MSIESINKNNVCTVDYVAGRNSYIGYLISLGVYFFKWMKVGIDYANGSSWNMAKSIFEVLGAKCYVINVQPNGFNTNICSRTAVVSVVSGPDISFLKVCIHRGWYSYQS